MILTQLRCFLNIADDKSISARQIGCTVGQFECSNKRCVPLIDTCDGMNDCDDWSDEIMCRKFN